MFVSAATINAIPYSATGNPVYFGPLLLAEDNSGALAACVSCFGLFNLGHTTLFRDRLLSTGYPVFFREWNHAIRRSKNPLSGRSRWYPIAPIPPVPRRFGT